MISSLPSPWCLLILSCSFGPLLTFCINLGWYRKPRRRLSASGLRAISVLIPARNEEASIVAAVESILASADVKLELLVLDDASLDRTAELVQSIAARDARVQLLSAPALPPGWNGKQHACAVLAKLARYDTLCFLDADVRLEPGTLAALLEEQQMGDADLLSGFPCEETGSWLEKLLIPQIHFILLCFCPLPFLRAYPRLPGLAAGCGQLMVVRRSAYEASGGHAAIRETMHDGLLLPRLLRSNGFATDLFDLTDLARCRMYRNAGEVWRGLGKNATEGMAAPARILPFSGMLLLGQVLPAVWLVQAILTRGPVFWPALAVGSGYLIRAVAAWRFRQSLLGALLHPLGVATLLLLQWWAFGRKLLGRQTVWKQRAYDLG